MVLLCLYLSLLLFSFLVLSFFRSCGPRGPPWGGPRAPPGGVPGAPPGAAAAKKREEKKREEKKREIEAEQNHRLSPL